MDGPTHRHGKWGPRRRGLRVRVGKLVHIEAVALAANMGPPSHDGL